MSSEEPKVASYTEFRGLCYSQRILANAPAQISMAKATMAILCAHTVGHQAISVAAILPRLWPAAIAVMW